MNKQQELDKLTDKFRKAQENYLETIYAIFTVPPRGDGAKDAVHAELNTAYSKYLSALRNLNSFTKSIVDG